MKKYLKFFRRIFILSFLKMRSYSQDFFVTILIIPLFMFAEVGFILFTVNASNTATIAGYNASELVFIVLFAQFVTDIACFTTVTSAQLPYQILRGELDFFFIKPIPAILGIGIQQFFVKSFLSMAYLSTALLCTIYLGNLDFTFITSLQGIFVLFQSAFLFLIITFGAGLLSFFFDGLRDIQELIHDSKNKVSRYPAEMFPKIFQNIFTFVFPVLLIASPMLKVLQGTYTVFDFLLAASVTLFFLVITVLLWHFGLQRYQSAN